MQRTSRALGLLLSMAAFCGVLCAQDTKTIILKLLDGRTGKPITPSSIMVRIDHQQALHSDWVVVSEDGTAKLTVPSGASVLSIHATYENAMLAFSNCDAAKEKDPDAAHWYSIPLILSSGVVAPNECIGKKVPEKLQVFAKPGEFVLFVRRLAPWKEAVE